MGEPLEYGGFSLLLEYHNVESLIITSACTLFFDDSLLGWVAGWVILLRLLEDKVISGVGWNI